MTSKYLKPVVVNQIKPQVQKKLQLWSNPIQIDWVPTPAAW